MRDRTPRNKLLDFSIFIVAFIVAFFIWQASLLKTNYPCGYAGFGVLNGSTGCIIGTYCSVERDTNVMGVCRPVIQMLNYPLIIK